MSLRHSAKRLNSYLHDESLGDTGAAAPLKWGNVVTPDTFVPLQDINSPQAEHLTPSSLATHATVLTPPITQFLPAVSPSVVNAESTAALVERRAYSKSDLVKLFTEEFDRNIVPDMTHSGDRKDLKQWIPADCFEDGALTPKGLYVVNELVCVRLSERTAKNLRAQRMVVVPRGHQCGQKAQVPDRKKNLWCLLCPDDDEDENGAVRRFNPKIEKRDRHVWKSIHRKAIAEAIGTEADKLPGAQAYQCPFYESPKCGHKWAGRTDVVVKHTNNTCKANPHSLGNWRRRRDTPLPVPGREPAYTNPSESSGASGLQSVSAAQRGQETSTPSVGMSNTDTPEPDGEPIYHTSPEDPAMRSPVSCDPCSSLPAAVGDTSPSARQSLPPSASSAKRSHRHPDHETMSATLRTGSKDTHVLQSVKPPTQHAPAPMALPEAASQPARRHSHKTVTPPARAPHTAYRSTRAAALPSQSSLGSAVSADEVAFMSQSFDFELYEKDRLAFRELQKALHAAQPGRSSPLKRKCPTEGEMDQ